MFKKIIIFQVRSGTKGPKDKQKRAVLVSFPDVTRQRILEAVSAVKAVFWLSVQRLQFIDRKAWPEYQLPWQRETVK